MEIGRSFSFPFGDRTWLSRTLVGAGLEILPLVLTVPMIRAMFHFRNSPSRWLAPLLLAVLAALLARFVVLGYLRRLAKSVLEGPTSGLPPWDHMGEDLVEGFKLWVLMVALFVPAAAVTAAVVLLAAVAGASETAWLPAVILGLPAALLTLFYLPAALLVTIATGELAAAFDFRRVTAHMGRVFPSYLLAIAVALASEIFAQLGLVLLCVGIFATRFLAHCVTVHAFACSYRDGLPDPPGPSALN